MIHFKTVLYIYFSAIQSHSRMEDLSSSKAWTSSSVSIFRFGAREPIQGRKLDLWMSLIYFQATFAKKGRFLPIFYTFEPKTRRIEYIYTPRSQKRREICFKKIWRENFLKNSSICWKSKKLRRLFSIKNRRKFYFSLD